MFLFVTMREVEDVFVLLPREKWRMFLFVTMREVEDVFVCYHVVFVCYHERSGGCFCLLP